MQGGPKRPPSNSQYHRALVSESLGASQPEGASLFFKLPELIRSYRSYKPQLQNEFSSLLYPLDKCMLFLSPITQQHPAERHNCLRQLTKPSLLGCQRWRPSEHLERSQENWEIRDVARTFATGQVAQGQSYSGKQGGLYPQALGESQPTLQQPGRLGYLSLHC